MVDEETRVLGCGEGLLWFGVGRCGVVQCGVDSSRVGWVGLWSGVRQAAVDCVRWGGQVWGWMGQM